MRERDGAVGVAVGEEPEGLVDGGAVRVVVIGVAARVQLEGADGEEGLVRGVAVGRGVEDGAELGELGARRGGDAEGAAGGGRYRSANSSLTSSLTQTLGRLAGLRFLSCRVAHT